MKGALGRIIIFLLLVMIALSPWIEHLKGPWQIAPTFQPVLDRLVGLFGTLFAILAAYFALEFHFQANTVKDLSVQIRDLLTNRSVVKKIAAEVFYVEFLAAAKLAKEYIYISYLSSTPPHLARQKDREEYYNEMDKLIKRGNGAQFRRLIRDTPQNAAWVCEMLTKHQKTPRYEIAIIKDSGEEEMPLGLSVQVIDGIKAWVVAVGSHEQGGSYRDLYINSNDFAAGIADYHNRLWVRSSKLLSSSTGLTEEGKIYLAKHSKGSPEKGNK